MTATQGDVARLVVIVEQVLHEVTLERDAFEVAVVAEDDDVVLVARALAEHLVVDASQERLVHQLLRLDVGRKRDEGHERQLELLARVERQEVHTAFERHNPPVQQVAGRHTLPAKVVDDQHAAVGQRLYGRLVEPGAGVEAQLQRLERQLAAHHHHGAPAADPAPVHVDALVQPDARLARRQFLVRDGVEQPDDRPFHFERIGDVQVAIEQFLDGLRDHRLAVARRPVDEHRVAGVDGGPQLVHHAVADDQMRKSLPHALTRRGVGRLGLVLGHVALVLRQGHRCRADVVVRLQKQLRARPPCIGDAVAIGRAPDHGAACDLHLVLRLDHLQRRVDDREPKA